jgi:hypothetical protein
MKMPGFTAGASLYNTSGHYTITASFNGPTTGATVLLQLAIPEPEPGCWFNGTACYGFLQRCKYCCWVGGSYTRACGTCFGWYNAPACLI